MPRNGTKNLIPVTQRAKEVQKKIQSKGGKARAEKIQHQKNVKAALEIALGIIKKTKAGQDLTIAEALAQKLVQSALSGDWKAMQMILELMHGKEQKLDVTSSDGSMSPLDVKVEFVRAKQE